MINRQPAQVIAHNWHGGQESSMYAFASTGCIQSDSHRADLIQEIETNIAWTAQHLKDNPGDKEYTLEPGRLEKLKEYAEKTPLSTDFHTDRIPDDVWKAYSCHDDGLDDFARAYVEAALWSSSDDDGDPLTGTYDLDDIAEDTLSEMKKDCADFQVANKELLAKAKEIKPGYDDAQAGHDFWLTRNGHGAGFWDRGLGEVGDKLTEMSKPYGSVDLYIGDDDEKVHS